MKCTSDVSGGYCAVTELSDKYEYDVTCAGP